MTNEFFAELARCLRKQEIDSKINQDKRLEVFLLPEMSGNDEAGDLYHEVAQTADEVWDYVEAVQTSDLLSVSGLSEEFHLLADFGGALLAGREREQGSGYQFVTWIWDYYRTGVCYGHYYEDDFTAAKQDFAVRSGLISKAQLFSPEELTELYRGIDYFLENGPELQEEQLKATQAAREKIEYTVPNLQERLNHELDQGQQLS
jgi:hypothetical protein